MDASEGGPKRPNLLNLCMDQWQSHMEPPDEV